MTTTFTPQRMHAATRVLLALALIAAVDAGAAASAAQKNYAQQPEVREFIAQMVAEHGFDGKSLRHLFAQVRYQPKVIAAITRPVLAPPKWYEYAPRFLNPEHIGAGIAFWQEHAEALERAQKEYGVPAEVVVAILGVETYYGRHTGSYRVIDALTTLAFDYPRRADYFRSELSQFLLLTRENGVSPLAPKGSFAGAMGLPQFMPGSVRAYAVDYDGDGRIELATGVDDAIGSVAHYLARHAWQPGQPVMTPARIEPADRDLQRWFDGGIAERRPVAAWVNDGVTGFAIPGDLAPDPVGLLMLETADAPGYWLVFGNWYVLTRYNRSRLYASAVWELATALRSAMPQAAAMPPG